MRYHLRYSWTLCWYEWQACPQDSAALRHQLVLTPKLK